MDLLTNQTNANFELVREDAKQTNKDVATLGVAIDDCDNKITVNNVLGKALDATTGILEAENKVSDDLEKKAAFEEFVLEVREKKCCKKTTIIF